MTPRLLSRNATWQIATLDSETLNLSFTALHASKHPKPPLPLDAGQRRFPEAADSEPDSESDTGDAGKAVLGGLDNSLLLWRFRHSWMTIDGPSAAHAEALDPI